MTELRKKMIRAMELRDLSRNSQRSYLNAVSGLTKYYMQPPDKVTKQMIEDYLLYLKQDKGNALTSVGSVITGLKFFYHYVVGDEQLSPSCTFAKTPRKLPTVLSPEEIFSVIDATDNQHIPQTFDREVQIDLDAQPREVSRHVGTKGLSHFFLLGFDAGVSPGHQLGQPEA